MLTARRDRLPLPLALLMLVFTVATGCAGYSMETTSGGESTGSSSQAVISCPAGQTLASFQRTSTPPGPVADAEIRSGVPGSNYGAQSAANVGLIGSPAAARSTLIRFDVSSLPAWATIQSATVTLVNNLAPVTGTVNASTNLATWGESSVTWTSAPSYSAVVASQGNSGSAGSAFAMTLPSSVVQGWYGGTNYGLRLDEASGTSSFFSSEYGTTASRPRLDVCYTVTLPDPCANAVKDGAETDIDCGGGTCSGCAPGKVCNAGSDCASGICYAGLCYALGGESTLPETSGDLTPATAITPTSISYGSDAAQVCDVYAPATTATTSLRVMVVSSGFTGGSRTASLWSAWASWEVAAGNVAVVCDVRHSAAGGVNPFPAPLADVRGLLRKMPSIATTYGGTTPVKLLGGSAGGSLALLAATTMDLTVLASANTALDPDTTIDDATLAIAWSSSDVALISRVVAWAAPTDLRVKAKIDSGTQTNMDAYVDCPTGESDAKYVDRAWRASAVHYFHPGQPPILLLHGTDDLSVYAEQSAGSGNVPVARTTGLLGTYALAHAAGVNATVILASSGVHLPTFAPLATGTYSVANWTAAAF